jgi:hypothetical protein
MSSITLRAKIAKEAARLLVQRRESEFYQARLSAARKLCRGFVPQQDLPTSAEIRGEIQALARLSGKPTGHRSGEVFVDGELFGDSPADEELSAAADRLALFRAALVPLEHVRENPARHPEGDALYHSLQVFELAREASPHDEELLLAALLHDVGKAIDPLDHVAAGLAALDGAITERTAWLIENHLAARRLLDGALGVRAWRRLRRSDDYDALLLLARCDRAGRRPGGAAPDLDDALAYIETLSVENG